MARDKRLREALLGNRSLSELPRSLGDWILAEIKDPVDPQRKMWATGIHDLLEVVRIVHPDGEAAEEEDA